MRLGSRGATTAIALLHIKALGLDPNALQAVQREQIPVLPFVFDGAVGNSGTGF
jgi:hypothetical protein